jgi:hypothetical protein
VRQPPPDGSRRTLVYMMRQMPNALSWRSSGGNRGGMFESPRKPKPNCA